MKENWDFEELYTESFAEFEDQDDNCLDLVIADACKRSEETGPRGHSTPNSLEMILER